MARTKMTARKASGGLAPRKVSGLKSPAKIRDLAAAEKQPRCQECGLALSTADIVEDKENPGHELALTDTTHCLMCVESRQAREAEREARKASSAEEEEEEGDAHAQHKYKHKRLTRTIDKKHQQGAKSAGTKKNKEKKEKPERKGTTPKEAKSLSKSFAEAKAEEEEKEEDEEDHVPVDASNKYVKALQQVYATYTKPVNIVVYKRGLHVVVRNEPPAGKSTWTRDDLIHEAERMLRPLVIIPGGWAGDFCVYHVTGYVPDGSVWMVGFPSHYKDRESVMVIMPEQPESVSDWGVGFAGRDLAAKDREGMEVLAVIQRTAPTDEFHLI